MNRRTRTVVFGLALLIGGATAVAQERRMDVRQRADSVFSEPVEKIVPELAGASPTDRNGRVGNELVFWGYRLRDGREAYLFACAMSEQVDCEARVPMICPNRANVISTATAEGKTVRRQCRLVALTQPGDVRPGCVDSTQRAPLAVGLVSCGG